MAKNEKAKNFYNEPEFPPFSVAMSVYRNDDAECFKTALNSIINQTVPPSEIVLVIDGVVTESIHKVIEEYQTAYAKEGLFKVIKFSENKGLGKALKAAVQECSFELVARMDSDDIAVPDRFEQQLKSFVKNKNITIIGGDIQEFEGSLENKAGKRIVPVTNCEIRQYMKKRCPFNHMTVMFKKSDVLEAGGYQDLFYNEDYWLWVRMAEKKYIMANTGTVLVNVRISKDMYQRRGGRNYFESEKFLQKYMLNHGIITYREYAVNMLKRYIMQIILPNKIRGWAFQMFARS